MADNLQKVTDDAELSDELNITEDILDKLKLLPEATSIDKLQIRKDLFISTLYDPKIAGNVSAACQLTTYSLATVYFWRSKDAKFKRDWDIAVIAGDIQMMTEAEYFLRKQVTQGDMTAIKYTLNNRGKKRWGEAATQTNTQVNINISAEKRKELNDKFKQFIEAETIK